MVKWLWYLWLAIWGVPITSSSEEVGTPDVPKCNVGSSRYWIDSIISLLWDLEVTFLYADPLLSIVRQLLRFRTFNLFSLLLLLCPLDSTSWEHDSGTLLCGKTSVKWNSFFKPHQPWEGEGGTKFRESRAPIDRALQVHALFIKDSRNAVSIQ